MCLAALVFWASRPAVPSVRSAEARIGEFVDAVQMRGEVKAGRSITIIAPSDAGDLRIMKLAQRRTAVKKGDVIVEFDGITVNRTLDEKKSEVRGFEAQIEKSRAESRTTEQTSVTAEMTAGYDVERGKLDYSAKEILSRVEGEQRGLEVNDNEQKLLEASANLSSDPRGGSAKVAATGRSAPRRGSTSTRPAAAGALKVTAPADGVVDILRNWRRATG